MGDEVHQQNFSATDYGDFQLKVEEELTFIRQLFAQKKFDQKTRKLGYELELCLIDSEGLPASLNNQLLNKTKNPLFTCELATFNLEINGNPFSLTPSVFNNIERDLSHLYQQVEKALETFSCQPILFGVLPSLQLKHLDPDLYMSNMDRYRLISQRLMEMRQRPVHLEIQGEDKLSVNKADVMLESLGTSLQVHYQFPAEEAVDSYHAALWASLAAVAVSANSPRVLQHNCWDESRIAIFKQAVDTRSLEEEKNSEIPRVHLANGYINSWLELFEENDDYSPILPEIIDTPVNDLHHFKLHNGTIWRWVRPIIDSNNDAEYHLRLEYRAVPSGPTLVDTIANMVFQIALTEGLKLQPKLLTQVPFERLNTDFYQVARNSLAADITWCNGKKDNIKALLLNEIIPCAYLGLKKLNLESANKWLEIIQQRIITGQTGAQWIKLHQQKHHDDLRLVNDYLAHSKQNIPVHLWPQP